MKFGITLYTVYCNSSNEPTYRIELWLQPWRRYLAARVYHWYDMHIFKVPGFKLVENANLRWKMRRNPGRICLPLSAEQDCRCYYLARRDRRVLARFPVDEATYEALGQFSSG